MPKLTLQTLGRKLIEKRGAMGIREAAQEIGVSPATLSRVERGHMADLETFGKICRWLNVDPGEVLGVSASAADRPRIGVHFRKDQALKPGTAHALAQMILAAQRALLVSEGAEESR
jgi:DNA-binding Xre family transcriptional regulator